MPNVTRPCVRDYPLVLRFEAVLRRMERRGPRRDLGKFIAARARLVGRAYAGTFPELGPQVAP